MKAKQRPFSSQTDFSVHTASTALGLPNTPALGENVPQNGQGHRSSDGTFACMKSRHPLSSPDAGFDIGGFLGLAADLGFGMRLLLCAPDEMK